MKRIANTATVAATAATATASTQNETERKSAERSTSMKRSTSTKAATTKSAKPVQVDVIDRGWSFTPSTVTLNGHEFAATKFDVAKNGDVYVLANVEGAGLRLHFGKTSPAYHAALEVATATKAQPKAEQPAGIKPAEPAKPVESKAAEPAKQAKPATKRKAPAKAAKQPEAKPAKPAAEPAKPVAKAAEPAAQPKAAMPAVECWHGLEVTGKGWRIEFSTVHQRTMVFLDDMNNAKQKAAIDAAGFYWSNTTKSWNKKLTRKAYRAAQALAETLNTLK